MPSTRKREVATVTPSSPPKQKSKINQSTSARLSHALSDNDTEALQVVLFDQQLSLKNIETAIKGLSSEHAELLLELLISKFTQNSRTTSGRAAQWIAQLLQSHQA